MSQTGLSCFVARPVEDEKACKPKFTVCQKICCGVSEVAWPSNWLFVPVTGVSCASLSHCVARPVENEKPCKSKFTGH